MWIVPDRPIPEKTPSIARWLAPAGIARARVHAGPGTAVMALPGRYGVTYLVRAEDHLVVVDMGSSQDVGDVAEAVRWARRAGARVAGIVLSHLHFDHLMGADALALRLGCPIRVQARAFEAFEGGPPLRYPHAPHLKDLLAGWLYQGLPLLTAQDLDWIRQRGLTHQRNPFQAPVEPLPAEGPIPDLPGWEVVPTPGHSDDSACLLHRKAGFLVTGDTVRNFLGGEWNPVVIDPEQYQESRERLLRLPVRTVFPGHGPVLQGEDVLHRLRTVRPETA
ncbi:MBL fold metallo-hydrolase [Myxococcota bacterium]|nr:MBL fold metallo-hydrolase [Myxococcota bacterium]